MSEQFPGYLGEGLPPLPWLLDRGYTYDPDAQQFLRVADNYMYPCGAEDVTEELAAFVERAASKLFGDLAEDPDRNILVDSFWVGPINYLTILMTNPHEVEENSDLLRKYPTLCAQAFARLKIDSETHDVQILEFRKYEFRPIPEPELEIINLDEWMAKRESD